MSWTKLTASMAKALREVAGRIRAASRRRATIISRRISRISITSNPRRFCLEPVTESFPQNNMSNNNEVAVIKTTEGEMVIELWPDVAPGHVENFKKLAGQGFYDGTCFHRVIKDFMIQGGDPLTKDPKMEARWGTGDPGYKIKAEFNDRHHDRGVLSMARSNDPNSAGSQF